MSSDKTTNLALHKWAGTDPVERTEFNDNFGIIDSKIGEHAAQIAQKVSQGELSAKADKLYVETQLAAINGGPKGAYATLAALQAAFPSGDTYNYVVTADNKWYYWNGTAWTAANVYQSTGIADGSVTSAKLSTDVALDINQVKLGNVYSAKQYAQNKGYIKSSDFTLVNGDPNFVYTDMIPIEVGTAIQFELRGAATVYSIVFYNNTGIAISGVISPNSPTTVYKGTVTAPVGTVSVRFCWAERYNTAEGAGKGTYGDSVIKLSVNVLDQINAIDASIRYETELFDQLYSGVKNTGFLNPTGTVGSTSDTNFIYSDFIPYSSLTPIEYSLWGDTLVGSICFYDTTKTFIQSVSVQSNAARTGTITPPPNMAFIRLSAYNPTAFPTRISSAVVKTSVKDRIVEVQEIVDGLSNSIDNFTVDLLGYPTTYGYLNNSGGVNNTTDTNWLQTKDFIPFEAGRTIEYTLWGAASVGSICFYDASRAFIQAISVPSNIANNGSTVSPVNTKFIKICVYNKAVKPERISTVNWVMSARDMIQLSKQEIGELQATVGIKKSIPYVFPYKVYTVCNDIVPTKKGHNRNYSSAIYLDHLFNGLTQEEHIRFTNGQDRVLFYSPIKVTDSNETNPTVEFNKGVTVLEEVKAVGITGSDIVESQFNVIHASTLNSATANGKPRVLCIGDSITYGELAQINDDDHQQNFAYHLMCKEFFMKDNIDAGSGHDCLFLGHYKKTRTMNYKGVNYPVTTHHEGIRGISLSSYLNGGVADFTSSSTNKFSINAWLSKYRTMNDTGNRLTLGNGTGTLITAANINDIDVCTPTHVFIMLGTNNGGTLAQYQELIGIIKAEYPSMIIGITVPDSAGTFFPSLHQNFGSGVAYWENSDNATKHSMIYGIVDMLQKEYGNPSSEASGIFFVPFYFVQPTAESFALRKVDLPDSVFQLTSRSGQINDPYGWGYHVHINGIGHTNWGYQLYSWLKYTIAKGL